MCYFVGQDPKMGRGLPIGQGGGGGGGGGQVCGSLVCSKSCRYVFGFVIFQIYTFLPSFCQCRKVRMT